MSHTYLCRSVARNRYRCARNCTYACAVGISWEASRHVGAWYVCFVTRRLTLRRPHIYESSTSAHRGCGYVSLPAPYTSTCAPAVIARTRADARRNVAPRRRKNGPYRIRRRRRRFRCPSTVVAPVSAKIKRNEVSGVYRRRRGWSKLTR